SLLAPLRPNAALTLRPTAFQTFGDDSTCTLEKCPASRNHSTARRKVPLPHTTVYVRAAAFTRIRRGFMEAFDSSTRADRSPCPCPTGVVHIAGEAVLIERRADNPFFLLEG